MRRVAMRSSGVSLLMCVEDQVPWVVHWGADVGALGAADFDALTAVSRWSVNRRKLQ